MIKVVYQQLLTGGEFGSRIIRTENGEPVAEVAGRSDLLSIPLLARAQRHEAIADMAGLTEDGTTILSEAIRAAYESGNIRVKPEV